MHMRIDTADLVEGTKHRFSPNGSSGLLPAHGRFTKCEASKLQQDFQQDLQQDLQVEDRKTARTSG